MKRAAIVLASLFAIVLIACGSGAGDGDSGFDQSCKTRGGTPTTVKRDGSKVRICQAPPAPVHQ